MKISIIIPTFDYDKYVARAIRSCIEQTFAKSDFEIVVVNDASKDSTRYILESYGYWINVIENETNMGLPFSRNKGIRNARGEFIVNLDADDYLHPDFLKVCYLSITLNNYDAVGTDYYLVDDNECVITRMNILDNAIACGIVYKKRHMEKIGLYDPSLRIGEDLDFRVRFDKEYSVKRINLPLYRYRMHKKNSTLDAGVNQEYLDLVGKKNECEVSHVYPAERYRR